MGKLLLFPGVKQTTLSVEATGVCANAVPKGTPKSGLTVDTRIYYGGDMCNQSGFGTVTERMEATRYGGSQVHIAMDDGRRMWITETMFSDEYKGHGGTRFVTEVAYNAFRAAQQAEFQRRFPSE